MGVDVEDNGELPEPSGCYPGGSKKRKRDQDYPENESLIRWLIAKVLVPVVVALIGLAGADIIFNNGNIVTYIIGGQPTQVPPVSIAASDTPASVATSLPTVTVTFTVLPSATDTSTSTQTPTLTRSPESFVTPRPTATPFLTPTIAPTRRPSPTPSQEPLVPIPNTTVLSAPLQLAPTATPVWLTVSSRDENGATHICSSSGDHQITIIGGAYNPFGENAAGWWRTIIYVFKGEIVWDNNNEPLSPFPLGNYQTPGNSRESAEAAGLGRSVVVPCSAGEMLRIVTVDTRGSYQHLNSGDMSMAIGLVQ